MTISLTVVQRLLVITALLWALLPTWGGLAFAAAWLLMAVATYARNQKARLLLENNLDKLKTLPEEGLAFTRRFPLAYVWPSSAEQWGTTWQMTGLLSVFLAIVFVLRALFAWDPTILFLLIPVAVQLVAGGGMARKLKVGERVREDLKAMRVTHDTTVTLLRLKATVGQWPPEPSPDTEPATTP
jgi:hypothetical protein